MINPKGQMFQNGQNQNYIYSPPIQEVGLIKALESINAEESKFKARYKSGRGYFMCDEEEKFESFFGLGLLYLFSVEKIELALSGKKSMASALKSVSNDIPTKAVMPSADSLRRLLSEDVKPQINTLKNFMKWRLELHKKCGYELAPLTEKLGLPANFLELSNKEQQQAIREQEGKVKLEHAWELYLLFLDKDKTPYTYQLIESLIRAEIGLIKKFQTNVDQIKGITTDDEVGEAFLSAVQETLTAFGVNAIFQPVVDFVLDGSGFCNELPKKWNHKLSDTFQEGLLADDTNAILVYMRRVRIIAAEKIIGLLYTEIFPNEDERKVDMLEYIGVFGDEERGTNGTLKYQNKKVLKLKRYIREEYKPFQLFIKLLQTETGLNKNQLIKLMPTQDAVNGFESNKRKLNKWENWSAWSKNSKNATEYNIDIVLEWVSSLGVREEVREELMFVFYVVNYINKIHIPEIMLLPEKEWKDYVL